MFLSVKAVHNAGNFDPLRHKSLALVSALGSDAGTLQTHGGDA